VGFRDRSVYCADLYRLISHVKNRFGADYEAHLASQAGR
jgi:hypothetical protein